MTKVTVSEDIKGSAAAVWAALGDFAGIKVGGPITDFSTEGEGVGMTRTIVMGGARIVERLDAHDPAKMYFAYSIINDDCPLPVNNYRANVQISDKGDGTTNVTWIGEFEPKGDEAAAVQAVEGIYRGGIAGARKAVES